MYHRIRSLTQSVGAMLGLMAQLRRGQLRMVVYVVGSCFNLQTDFSLALLEISGVMITTCSWRYCLSVAMITRWHHYYIDSVIVTRCRYHLSEAIIARWRYCLNAVMITRWQNCIGAAMITRWHYRISVEMVTGWVHWIVNVSNCKSL